MPNRTVLVFGLNHSIGKNLRQQEARGLTSLPLVVVPVKWDYSNLVATSFHQGMAADGDGVFSSEVRADWILGVGDGDVVAAVSCDGLVWVDPTPTVWQGDAR